MGPSKTTDAFARAARAQGAPVHFDCAVQAVTTSADTVSGVVTERGEIRASSVVCAAGAWSSRLARIRFSRFAEGAIGKPRNVL